MNVVTRVLSRAGAVTALVLLLGSCATTNRLDRHNLENEDMGMMREFLVE